MIFTLCFLSLFAGCCNAPTMCTPRGWSILAARVQTLGPEWHHGGGPCGECSDCIPCKPIKDVYEPWHDNLVTEHTAHRCAYRALDEYRSECGRPMSHHFKRGFIMAYEDLAMNRAPRPRIVPPPLYWNAYYRSCAGRPFVDDWFAGYDAGLAKGANSGVSQFHEIYLRRCNGTVAGACGCPVQQAGGYVPPNGQAYDDANDAHEAPNGYSAPDGYAAPNQGGYAAPGSYTAPTTNNYTTPGVYAAPTQGRY